MIEYGHELFGIASIFRVHGSSVSRGVVPAVFSTMILIVIVYGLHNEIKQPSTLLLDPYAISILISAITFVITFRANYAYGRYWEACTAIHLMLSKWLDCAACTASFHYQSKKFDTTKPQSFGNHPDLEHVSRRRENILEGLTAQQYMEKIDSEMADQPSNTGGLVSLLAEKLKEKKKKSRASSVRKSVAKSAGEFMKWFKTRQALERKKRPGSGQKSISMVAAKTIASSIHSIGGDSTLLQQDVFLDESLASPFLNELVHLSSLLSAVAFATLRTDVLDVQTPLVSYTPGEPFPPVDPDKETKAARAKYSEGSRFWAAIYFLLGIDQSDKHRTLNNHARPFQVLGGVSDQEVEALREARGPYAKVALCFSWLQEFLIREQLNGGLGPISPAIVTRAFQFSSDGMRGYNDARKVAYINFPFPHAQLTIIFTNLVVWIFPFLFFSYVNNVWFACILNFVTVLCFCGLHEVARELEAPFRHPPNNIPLTTFQAHFNEALLTTWAGFHPDSWFEVPAKLEPLPDLIAEISVVEGEENDDGGENSTTEAKGPLNESSELVETTARLKKDPVEDSVIPTSWNESKSIQEEKEEIHESIAG